MFEAEEQRTPLDEGVQREVDPELQAMFTGQPIPEKKDTGLGPIADYPIAFFGMGAIDSAAMVAAGGAGVYHGATQDTVRATEVIEYVAEEAYKNYTLPLMQKIDPNDDSLVDAYNNIGEAVHWLINGAGTASVALVEAPVSLAEKAGLLDKEKGIMIRAAANAHGQMGAVAAMIALGQGAHVMIRGKPGAPGKASGRKKGPKPDEDFTQEDYANILHTATQRAARGGDAPRLTYDIGERPSKPAKEFYSKERGDVIEGEVVGRPERRAAHLLEHDQPVIQLGDDAVSFKHDPAPVQPLTFQEWAKLTRVEGEFNTPVVRERYTNYIDLMDEMNIRLEMRLREMYSPLAEEGMQMALDGSSRSHVMDNAGMLKEIWSKPERRAQFQTYVATEAARVVARNKQEVARMVEQGWTVDNANAALAGQARLRSSALIQQDHAFGRALAKFVGMKNFEGMVDTKLPGRTKQELIAMLDRVGKRKALGGAKYTMADSRATLAEAVERRFGQDAAYKMGQQAHIQGKHTGRNTPAEQVVQQSKELPWEQYPGQESANIVATRKEGGAMREVNPREYLGTGEFTFDSTIPNLPDYMALPDFSFAEKVALHQELHGSRIGLMMPDQRILLPDAGESLQAMAKRLDIDVQQAKDVAVSPRGEVYTPGEFQALRAVVGPLFKMPGMEISVFRIPTFAEQTAVHRFRATMDKFLKDSLKYLSKDKPYFGKQFSEFGIGTTRRRADPVRERTGLDRLAEYEAKVAEIERHIAQFEQTPEQIKAHQKKVSQEATVRKVRAKREREREAKREASARYRSRKRMDRYEEWYQAEGRRTGSATLDEALAHVARPTRKDIDGIYGRPAHEGGGGTTVQVLRKIWDELGIEGKKPRSIKELRRKIKANLADKELLQPMRKGQYIPAKQGRVHPRDLAEKWDGIDEHVAQMHELDFEHLTFEDEGARPMEGPELREVGEDWFGDSMGLEELDFDPRYESMNRGFRGQRGAIDPDWLTFGLASKLRNRKKAKLTVEDFDPTRKAYRIVDPILRRWARHAEENPDWRPDKQEFRDHKDSAWRTAKEVMGGHPLTPLWNKGAKMYEKGFPALMELLAMIEVTPRQRHKTGQQGILAWHQIRQTRFGEWLTSERPDSWSFQNVLNQIESKWFTGPRKIPNMLGRFGKHFPLGLNMHNIPNHLIKATKADLSKQGGPTTYAGKLLREYMDRLYNAAKTVGVPVAEYVTNYNPPVFKYREMLNDKMPLRKKFKELAERKGLDPAVTDEWLLSVINGEGLVRVRPQFREGRQINLRDPNLELQRRYLKEFTPEELAPFLIDDPFVAVQKYATDVVTRMAEVERFGAKDEIWNRQLDRAATQAKEAGLDLTVDDLRRITDMRLIMRHMYGEALPHLKELLRVGYGIESWSKLGMVVPGSLSELGLNLNNPMMWKEYSKALVTMGVPEMARTVARGIYRDLPRSRAFEIASDTGRVSSIMMHEHLTALNAADQGSVWSSLAFVANGLHPMTQGMVTATIAGFERAVHRIAKTEGMDRLGRKKLGKIERDFHEYDKKMLEYYGLKVDEVLKWKRDGAKLNGPWYQTKFVPAALKAANDGVLMPRGTNLPRWMARTSLGPLRYLYTYVTMLGNKITPEIAHMLQGGMLDGAPASPAVRMRNQLQGAGALASILALAILSEELRDWWLYGGTENRPGRKGMSEEEKLQEKIIRYISRSGFLGFAGAKGLDMLESGLHGRLDSGKMIENVVGSLYTDAARTGAVMLAGTMGDLSAKQLAQYMMSVFPMQTALPRGHKAPAGKQLSRKEIQKAWEDYFVAMGMKRGGRSKGAFSTPSVWK